MAKALKTSNVAENLLNREFREHGPRKVLLTDITYIPFDGGESKFYYLSVILDAHTKQVLSYEVSQSLEVDFVLETVRQLIEKHGISLDAETLIHSDHGCHYTSYRFIEIVKDNQLRQSMSRKGNCWDNAPQESFFGHMKDEIGAKFKECDGFEDIKAMIDDWMDYYNNERYQWELAKLSPNEYYEYLTSGVYPLPIRPPDDDQDAETLKALPDFAASAHTDVSGVSVETRAQASTPAMNSPLRFATRAIHGVLTQLGIGVDLQLLGTAGFVFSSCPCPRMEEGGNSLLLYLI